MILDDSQMLSLLDFQTHSRMLLKGISRSLIRKRISKSTPRRIQDVALRQLEGWRVSEVRKTANRKAKENIGSGRAHAILLPMCTSKQTIKKQFLRGSFLWTLGNIWRCWSHWTHFNGRLTFFSTLSNSVTSCINSQESESRLIRTGPKRWRTSIRQSLDAKRLC